MSDGKSMGAVHIGATAPSGESVVSRIERDIAHMVNHLLHLNYDLSGAYKTALRRVEDPELKRRMARVDSTHEPYVRELSEFVLDLGKTPTASGDLRSLLERGRVLLGDLSGEQGILEAMAANEAEIHTAYREVLQKPGMPPRLTEIVTRALQQETLHRAFYDDLLGRFVG